VAQARSQIRNLTVDEFARELEADTVTLIDIREPDEVGRTGAIPGAIQAPRGMLEFWADPAGPYHRTEFDSRVAHPALLRIGRPPSAGRPEPAKPRLHRRRAPGRRTEGLGGARPPRHPSRTELSHPTTAAATRADRLNGRQLHRWHDCDHPHNGALGHCAHPVGTKAAVASYLRDVNAGGPPGTPPADRRARVDKTVERLAAAGATFVAAATRHGEYCVTMLDPERNEFDVQ